MKERLKKGFEEVFGGECRVFFSPGRINLIGEHTDYNGGHVLPCALTLGTYAAARPNGSGEIRMFSENLPSGGVVSYDINDIKKRGVWADYAAGVITEFAKAGHRLPCGLDIYYYGDLPAGAGLSSSASIEVLTGVVLRSLFGFDTDNAQTALCAQRAENDFVGMNCGIMDQYAIAMGKSGNALFLDTNTLRYEYVPARLDGISVVAMDTGVKRGLAGSEYNRRRSECEAAAEKLERVCGKPALCMLAYAELVKHSQLLSETELKRARHAVTEDLRTKKAYALLHAGDAVGFGRLMNASHISLKEDFEVTGEALDAMVFSAWRQYGVIGARMTGAGFGGCAIALVRDESLDSFRDGVKREYERLTGRRAGIYTASIGGGPTEI